VILERLRLIDFRCYSGTVDIAFSIDSQLNTTIIQGTNGAGKTSILQALDFALYGRNVLTKDSPPINTTSLRAAREHEPAKTAVILNFRDSGNRYTLSRSLKGFLRNGKFFYSTQDDDVSVTFTKPDGNTERDPFPDQTIQRMLPSPIRTFFLFDGDRIADFTKPGRDRDDKISGAVNDVLHIESLSRAVEHTRKIATEKRRGLDRTGAPSVDKVSSELKLQELAVESRRRSIAQANEDLQLAKTRSDAVDQELSSIIAVAKLAQARKQVELKREGHVARASQLRKQLSRALVYASPSLANRKISAASEDLAKYKSRHEIPAKIADYFLTDLLQSGKCICGRDLGDGTNERQHLNQLLSSLVPNSLQDVATQLAAGLRPLKKDIPQRISAVVSILHEIEDNDAEIGRADRELERIGADIDSTAFDRAQVLERERSTLLRTIRELEAGVIKAERDLAGAVSYKGKLQERLSEEMGKQTGFREETRAWDLARKCSDALQEAMTILVKRLRATLGTEATVILKNLVSDDKTYFFSEVRVDDGFLLRVLDSQGHDIRPQLSMGETQVSSLAFMLAMTRLGGQEAPLVIDTPLARLDMSVRSHVAKWLPRLTPQLVLLVTDAEYGADVASELAPRVGTKMRLLPSEAGTSMTVDAYG
jgi:DNA sulfur modification protein DndD